MAWITQPIINAPMGVVPNNAIWWSAITLPCIAGSVARCNTTVSTDWNDVEPTEHPGETGKNNEDNYAIAAFQSASGEVVTLAIVADGIGGHRAGEVASELAARHILEVASAYSGEDYVAMLAQAVGQAARVVAEQAQAQRELKGMGTTCVVACVVGRRLYATYIGDSRLHYIHQGGIQQL